MFGETLGVSFCWVPCVFLKGRQTESYACWLGDKPFHQFKVVSYFWSEVGIELPNRL